MILKHICIIIGTNRISKKFKKCIDKSIYFSLSKKSSLYWAFLHKYGIIKAVMKVKTGDGSLPLLEF